MSHCEIDVELSPPFVYPANRPYVWILPCGTDKGAVYCKKLLKTLLMSIRLIGWLSYMTIIFHVAVDLYSNRLQKMSK